MKEQAEPLRTHFLQVRITAMQNGIRDQAICIMVRTLERAEQFQTEEMTQFSVIRYASSVNL